MRRIHVDRSRCRGQAECVARAPAAFRLDSERKSVVRPNTQESLENLRSAEYACPYFAIRIEEEQEPVKS